jgi:hypothetical protein
MRRKSVTGLSRAQHSDHSMTKKPFDLLRRDSGATDFSADAFAKD